MRWPCRGRGSRCRALPTRLRSRPLPRRRCRSCPGWTPRRTPPRRWPPTARRRVAEAAIAETPAHRGGQGEATSGAARIVAYVAAGVAVASLGGGALAYTKASSAHSDLTAHIHSGSEAQGLLETERKN